MGYETDPNSDRAFDKGEMNTYRELESTCKSFLPSISKFLTQLSPKMIDSALKEQLPESLLGYLLPLLPGGVIVYSINELVEYFQGNNCWENHEKHIINRIGDS